MRKKKILIIRLSSIGDIVLTTPVIRCLKQQLPLTEIHFLTKPVYVNFLENNPYIDVLHVLDQSPVRKGLELKNYGFDLVIDLHRNLRTALIKAAIGATDFSFDKLNFEKFIFTNFKFNVMPAIHIVDRYLNTVNSLGILNDHKGLDFFIPSTVEIEMKSSRTPFIAWAIGGQHETKKLPAHKIIDACKQLNSKIVLLGGIEDQEVGEAIAREAGSHVSNQAGKLSLNQSASVLKQASVVLTNDTGLMHIAAAFQKPIISFWGNTVPSFGMTPYYGNKTVPSFRFSEDDLYCRPCSKIGFDVCPQKHFKCMEMLDPTAIVSILKSVQLIP